MSSLLVVLRAAGKPALAGGAAGQCAVRDIWTRSGGSGNFRRWTHLRHRLRGHHPPILDSSNRLASSVRLYRLQADPDLMELASRLGGSVRFYRTSGPSDQMPASSAIEETVNRLKSKHVEKLKEIQKIQDIDERVKSVIALDQETSLAVARAKAEAKAQNEAAKKVVVAKKSLWQRFVDELKHYKSGFVLLFVDIKVSVKIAWKILHGHTMTRRESRQLTRTVGDLFRLVPFLAFVIIPFMEFLLPVALKLFPGMLPSTFATSSQTETKYRRQLTAKLEYAKFLQKTLDEMAPTDKDRSSSSARDFVNFYREIKAGSNTIDEIDVEKIKKFSKLFEDDITLDNMTRGQLTAICRLLELPAVGNKNILAFSIEMRLRHLKADDQVIQREGVDNMSVQELQLANKERGMRALGLQKEQLVKQLKDWLDLSLNAQVPPSLLLLSRTLYLPETIDPVTKLGMSISALPESAALRASAEIGMKEGKTRNVVKLEVIKEEQRKIDEEAAETLKQELLKKAEEEALAATAAAEQAAAANDQQLLDSVVRNAADAIKDAAEKVARTTPAHSQTNQQDTKPDVEAEPTVIHSDQGQRSPLEAVLKATDSTTTTGAVRQEVVDQVADKASAKILAADRELSVEDFSGLKTAFEKLGKVKTETEAMAELKRELEDYQEDVDDLSSVSEMVDRKGLRETKGAKMLHSRVNKMLGRVGKLVESLEGERKMVEEQLEQLDPAADESQSEKVAKKEKHLVTINELIDCVQHLENTPDAAKVDQIAEVLSLMDDDKDGVIQVDHVMKVIELLGTTHAKLPAKQIKQIVDMLSKEEMLEMEDNIEESMDKNTGSAAKTDTEEMKSLEDLEHLRKLEEAAVKAAAEAVSSSNPPDVDVPPHIKEMFDQEVAAEKKMEAKENKPQ